MWASCRPVYVSTASVSAYQAIVADCAHSLGKEKYIQQLDNYLKAGLIDRAEYKVMKERYEKLDIPEDYH